MTNINNDVFNIHFTYGKIGNPFAFSSSESSQRLSHSLHLTLSHSLSLTPRQSWSGTLTQPSLTALASSVSLQLLLNPCLSLSLTLRQS